MEIESDVAVPGKTMYYQIRMVCLRWYVRIWEGDIEIDAIGPFLNYKDAEARAIKTGYRDRNKGLV